MPQRNGCRGCLSLSRTAGMREIRSSSGHPCCRQAQRMLLVWRSNFQPVPFWPPPRRGSPAVTRRMLMRGSHRNSPRTSTEGHPRPHRPLRTCFPNFPSCPSSLQNFCRGWSGWNLSLACLLRHTNMCACTGRALKVSALVQLG